ncbi:MAG: pirin family protein [Actinomycetota bacterium]
MSPASTGRTKSVVEIITANRQIEGGGFEVFRPFPGPARLDLDPFLLLDEMAPQYHPPGSDPVGAPAHPHRGFETVTYVLAGEAEHRDSAGNHGIIGPGDVQWMTAGDGIVHSEMPSDRARAEGGLGHGLQLWVNLPAALRRTAPRYQALPASDLAQVAGDGWNAVIIAGSFFGVDGPAETHTPIGLARVHLEAGASQRLPVAEGHVAALYVYHGTAALPDERRASAQEFAVFDQRSGDMVIAADDEHALDAFVLTGQPIGEPIVRHGPFVMNTEAEIEEAILDFQAGRMGAIDPVGTV